MANTGKRTAELILLLSGGTKIKAETATQMTAMNRQ